MTQAEEFVGRVLQAIRSIRRNGEDYRDYAVYVHPSTLRAVRLSYEQRLSYGQQVATGLDGEVTAFGLPVHPEAEVGVNRIEVRKTSATWPHWLSASWEATGDE